MAGPQKLRLLIVVSQLGLGGLELQVLELVRGLDKNRFQVYVCPLWPIFELESDFRQAGAEIISIHKRHSLDVSVLPRLILYIRHNRIQVLHTWIFTANTWGRLAGWLARTPVIIASERNVDIWKGWHHRLIDRSLALVTQSILVNSTAVEDYLVKREGISPQKIQVIHNGIDVDRFLSPEVIQKPQIRKEFGIPAGCLIVGTVANFRPQKDYENFFAAMRQVKDKHPEARFLVVGGGTGDKAVVEIMNHYGLGEATIFLGVRRDMARVLQAMDVFVLASRHEGFSNSVLEAMLSGLPVVVTDVGGSREMIVDGTTGYIVPRENPAAIAECVTLLLSDPEKRSQIGQAAQNHVASTFSLEKMQQTYQKLYLSACAMKEE